MNAITKLTDDQIIDLYDGDEKAAVLAKFLNLDSYPELEFDSYDNNRYTVNEKPVLLGTSPKEYLEMVKAFKTLLTAEEIKQITNFIANAQKGLVDEFERQTLYDTLEADLSNRDFSPKQKKAQEKIKAKYFYVSNILYWVLRIGAEDKYRSESESKSIIAYAQAWNGETPEDNRINSTENDGEYLVLTDSEADDIERAYADDLLDDIAEIPSGFEMYFDRERWLDDHTGMRGENLSGYNGIEESEILNGIEYFIYRTN